MKEMEIGKGDIMLVHSSSVLAKIIQFGMKLKYWMELKFNTDKIQNHGGLGVGDNKIIEAINKFVTIWDINKAYSGHTGTEISIYSFDWSDEVLANMDKTKELVVGKKYQYSNFLSWAVNIFTFGKIWPGKRKGKSMERQYCHETVATIIYLSTKDELDVLSLAAKKHFRKFWKTSPNKTEKFCKRYGKLEAIYTID